MGASHLPFTNQMNVNIFVISADPRNAPRSHFQSQPLIQNLGPLNANSSTFIPCKSYVLVKWQISISLGTIFFSFLQVYRLRVIVAVEAVITNIYETFTIC